MSSTPVDNIPHGVERIVPAKRQTEQFLRSSALWGVFTVVSRVLGFAREVLMARTFGTSASASALVLAQTIPNVSQSLVSEEIARGAVVPVVADVQAADGDRPAACLAGAVMVWASVFMAVLAVAVWVSSSELVRVISHGAAVSSEPETVHLLRILAPIIALNGLIAAPSAALVARRRFGLAAASTAASNIPIVLVLLVHPNTGITAAAWALVAGVALQAAWQITASSRIGGIATALQSPALVRVWRLALPTALSLGAATISGLIDVSFSGLAGVGGAAALDKAFRLMLFPYSAIVVAFGVVALPALVEAADDPPQFEVELRRALRFALIAVVPIAAILVAIPTDLVHAVYEHGAFGASSTRLTAGALRGCGLILPAFALSGMGSRAWLSRQRPWPAAFLFVFGSLANAGLDWWLVRPFGLFGICVATAIVHGSVGLALLGAASTDCLGFFREIAVVCLKASVASALAVLVPIVLLGGGGSDLTVLTLAIAVPLFYSLASLALRVPEMGAALASLRGSL